MSLTYPNLKIALTFSGGGYRASSFDLGVLTYLDQVRYSDKSLLDQVLVLSSVSGGTITGIRYTQGIVKGQSMDKIFNDLYSFMKEVNLISRSLKNLAERERWKGERIASLINAISDVYDETLFNNGRFGDLIAPERPIHIKHFSFNAVDFRHALQFRFQQSENLIRPDEGEPPKGIIGNFYLQVPESIAEAIRLSDILAASTCFPGGFEPINFPGDFDIPDSKELQEFKETYGGSVGLMDGGMVDNQGIEPVLLANTRIKKNLKAIVPDYDDSENALDLIIVCDVSSPYMEEYEAASQKEPNWWRNLTVTRINIIINVFSLLFLALDILAIYLGNIALIVLFSCLVTIGIVGKLIIRYLISFPSRFNIPKFFLNPMKNLLRLRLLNYETMIVNRANSLLKMTNDVFTKHIRRLNYKTIWADEKWKNRRIMNAVYELRPGERKLNKKIETGRISEGLIPSDSIQTVANIASKMKTTLWFSEEELTHHGMLDSLIACGQFTTCWNLIEYIEKIEKNKVNINSSHLELKENKDILLEHWDRFKKDPFWMLDTYKTNYNGITD